MGRPGGGLRCPHARACCPHACHCVCCAAPPRGLIHLGAARRWIALPPARPAVFTLHKLGRAGWWGVWRSGIKEEAAGRGTAAAPNATPAWSATRPRYTTRQIASKLGLSGARTAGGQRSPAQSSYTAAPCPKTNLADQAGGAFGAAASRRRPQAGGQPQRRMPRRPGPRHHPATPPSRSHPNLALSAAGLLPPRLPLRVLRCPPEGANPALGRPGGGFLCPHARHCVSFAAPKGANPALGRPGGGLIWPGRVGRV